MVMSATLSVLDWTPATLAISYSMAAAVTAAAAASGDNDLI